MELRTNPWCETAPNFTQMRRCWQAASELPTGKKMLRAYRACLELPKTEEVKGKTKKNHS